MAQKLGLGAGAWARMSTETKNPIENSIFELENSELIDADTGLTPERIAELLTELKAEMENAARQLDFEQAARLRDRIFELEQLLLQ